MNNKKSRVEEILSAAPKRENSGGIAHLMYRTVVERNGYIVLQWDLADGSFGASPGWYGFTASEIHPWELLYQDTCFFAIHPEDTLKFSTYRNECSAKHSAETIIRLAVKNGGYHLVQLSAVVVCDSPGEKPKYVVVTLADIESRALSLVGSGDDEFKVDSGIVIFEVKDGMVKVLFANNAAGRFLEIVDTPHDGTDGSVNYFSTRAHNYGLLLDLIRKREIDIAFGAGHRLIKLSRVHVDNVIDGSMIVYASFSTRQTENETAPLPELPQSGGELADGTILLDYDIEDDTLVYSLWDKPDKHRQETLQAFRRDIDGSAVIHNEDRRIFKENLDKVIAGEKEAVFHLRYITKNGVVWHQTRLVGINDRNGILRRIIGWAVDIHRKTGEAGIEFQRELSIRRAITPNAILVTAFEAESGAMLRFEGEVLFPGCEDLGDFTAVKTFLLDRVAPEDIEEVARNEIWLNGGGNGGSRSFEMRITPFDGGDRRIWVKATFVRFACRMTGLKIVCFLLEDIDSVKTEMQNLLHEANRDPSTSILTQVSFDEFCALRRHDNMPENSINAVILAETDPYKTEKGIEGVDLKHIVTEKVEKVILRHVGDDVIAAKFGDTRYLLAVHGLESVEALREFVYILLQELRIKIDERISVTASIGAAICRHDTQTGYRCVYDHVEEALNRAKSYGGDRAAFYGQRSSAGGQPVVPAVSRYIFIRTFGRFEVFVDDRPIRFKHEKAKEMLAVLVDRKGGFVSGREMIGYLWDTEDVNRVTLSRCRKVAMWLKEELNENGVGDIIESEGRARRLCSGKVHCDLYDYLSHREKFADTYGGVYMSEYSWSEYTTAELNKELWAE